MKFILLAIDVVTLTAAWLLSCKYILGYETAFEFYQASKYNLPVLLVIKGFFFIRLGLYRAILRYASFHFAVAIVRATTFGSIFSFLLLNNFPFSKWPVGLFLLDWLITLFLVGSTRFLPRYYYSETIKLENNETVKKVLIYGAGDLGDAVARSLLTQNPEYKIAGFIDDDLRKRGKKLHDIPVLGSHADLEKIIKKHKINEIIIAYTSIQADWLRELIKECRDYHVFCRIAPKISDMMSHDVNIKNIDIVDLLKRDPKDLDEKQIDLFLRRKKILITGAAGSIGSELVRQTLRFRPKKIVLVDISEFGLYKIQEELKDVIADKKAYCRFKFILQDLCQQQRLDQMIDQEKPDIIFHAAAYKHVPLIEHNPSTGILNNIHGTMNIANAAERHGVEKFVLISTDKAVRPTNIMGASKRVCELYIQNLNLRSKTEYVAVRFGNVLGSSGSVVPKFLEQVKSGGPITVTHPEVTRYFMLIQEAVQLVMQAASIGHGGEIFILNMGKPVKIKEIAEDLVFLAGKEPYKDIDIQFTGLRPGEKLYEELLISDTEKKTQYENITIGQMTFIEWDELNQKITTLLTTAKEQDGSPHQKEALLLKMKSLVPELTHMDLPANENSVKVLPLRRQSQAYS